MNIAHIVCRFPPYGGGMGVVAFEQAKRLARQGHPVTVFTLSGKPRLDSAKLPFDIKYLKAFPRLGNGGVSPELFWQLRDFDIIHLHYPFYGAQEVIWLGYLSGLYRKTKLVIWYHMDSSLKNIFFRMWHWRTWLIQKGLFKRAAKVCAASLDYVRHSKIKKIYQKHPDKFVEIPFGTNQNPQRIDAARLKQLTGDLGLNSQSKVILFVGGLDSAHYFKGVPILIDAFHKLSDPNTKLLIVGGGNLRDDYERQVAGLNLSSQVFFAGRIDTNDLSAYYSLADLLVLPSTTPAEAFGLVLVEAMTFGKPVIGSDLPGVRDVVGAAGLTVKPGDAHDLSVKIKKLLSDKSLYTTCSRQASASVKNKYSWDKHLQELIKVYNYARI